MRLSARKGLFGGVLEGGSPPFVWPRSGFFLNAMTWDAEISDGYIGTFIYARRSYMHGSCVHICTAFIYARVMRSYMHGVHICTDIGAFIYARRSYMHGQ